MKAISNSSPLIYLAKISKLKLLRNIYDKILIPKEVFKEVVEEGKKLNQKEVILIEELINEKFISVEESRKLRKFEKLSQLHEGEIYAISLCLNLKEKNILIDDKEAYNFCKLIELTPIRTTAILLELLKEKIIDINEFKESLKNLSKEGFFIDINTFEYLLEEANKYQESSKSL